MLGGEVTTTSKGCNREAVIEAYLEFGHAYGVCACSTGRLLVINRNANLAIDWTHDPYNRAKWIQFAVVKVFPSLAEARAEADKHWTHDRPLMRRVADALADEIGGGA